MVNSASCSLCAGFLRPVPLAIRDSRSAASMSEINGDDPNSQIRPRHVRFMALVIYNLSRARVMPTKKRRRSSACVRSGLARMPEFERAGGNVDQGTPPKCKGRMPSSQPTMKTTRNSRPFAACKVRSDTRSARGSHVSTSTLQASSAMKRSRLSPAERQTGSTSSTAASICLAISFLLRGQA